MPILGGNQTHDWADSDDIDKKGLDSTHKYYQLDDDVAGQLKDMEAYKESCDLGPDYYKTKMKGNFMETFLTRFSKWLMKENVEVD